MKKLAAVLSTLVFIVGVSLIGLGTSPASAMTTHKTKSTTKCTISTTKGSTFAVSGNMVTATFTVKGAHCHKVVTLTSWKAPNRAGQPLSAQKLFAHTTGTFSAGVHSLSVQLPKCFWQIDLIRGSRATDSNGGPRFGVEHRFIRGLHGGHACVTKTTTTKPHKPQVKAATVTVAALPNTGPTSGVMIASVIGSLIVSTLAYRYYLSRRPA